MNAIQKRVAILQFFIALTATIIFSVGFATPNWAVAQNINLGLWQVCTENLCNAVRFENSPVYFLLVLAFECLGLVSFLVALFLSACLILNLPISQRKNIYAIIITSLIAISSVTAGAALFASKTPYLQLSFSFILVLVAAGVEILVGVLACVFKAAK